MLVPALLSASAGARAASRLCALLYGLKNCVQFTHALVLKSPRRAPHPCIWNPPPHQRDCSSIS